MPSEGEGQGEGHNGVLPSLAAQRPSGLPGAALWLGTQGLWMGDLVPAHPSRFLPSQNQIPLFLSRYCTLYAFALAVPTTWGVLPSALLIPIKPVRHHPPREVPGHHPRTVLSLQGLADVQMPCRTSAGAKVGKAIWKRTYLGCFTPLSCSNLLKANVSSYRVGVRGPQVAPSINTTHSFYYTVL